MRGTHHNPTQNTEDESADRQLWLQETETAQREGRAGQRRPRPVLSAPDRKARRHAARLLRQRGLDAVPFLCRALEDPDQGVKLAAVESLGVIGDPSALPALTAALHRASSGGSTRRQLLYWRLYLPLLGVLVVGSILFSLLTARYESTSNYVVSVVGYAGAMILMVAMVQAQQRGRFRAAIAGALADIAISSRVDKDRAGFRELRTLARSGWLHDRPARERIRQAVRTIAEATERGSHPIPALAPETEVSEMPIPARSPAVEDESLPLAAAGPGSHS